MGKQVVWLADWGLEGRTRDKLNRAMYDNCEGVMMLLMMSMIMM